MRSRFAFHQRLLYTFDYSRISRRALARFYRFFHLDYSNSFSHLSAARRAICYADNRLVTNAAAASIQMSNISNYIVFSFSFSCVDVGVFFIGWRTRLSRLPVAARNPGRPIPNSAGEEELLFGVGFAHLVAIFEPDELFFVVGANLQ